MGGGQGPVEGLGVSATLSWRDRPVLVTGASGLVGGRVVERLLGLGAQVVCLVRDWVPAAEALQPGTLARSVVVRGDLCEPGLVERALGEHEIATVLHLAAQTVVGIANRNPISTFESNVRGTWTLLEACRRSPKVAQVVVASSDKAYGEPVMLPYTEEAPLRGLYPYDASKACADLIAQSYAASFGLPVAITRCGNFFGPGDLNWSRLVPGTVRSVLRGERPVIRSDGSFVRDYLHVDDGAAAYLLLAEQLALRPELRGRAFNFSYERPLSVRGLVELILRTMGSPLEPVVLDEAVHEIRDQRLSAARARAELGWKPALTLEQGLAATVGWYRQLLETAP